MKDVQLHSQKDKKNENYTLVKYNFAPIRVAKIKSPTVLSVAEAVGKGTLLDCVWEENGAISLKGNLHLSFDPAAPRLEMHSEDEPAAV